MIKTIQHNGIDYPSFQGEGNAARFAIPFAQQVCKGVGCDVGCNRAEWAFKDINGLDALLVDPAICKEYNALNLPEGEFEYLFSSHMLEHVDNWVDVLDYWYTKLKQGGVLFLYLPDYSQTYWRPWHNRKHIHIFTPQIIKDFLTARGWHNIFVSGVDLNNSFITIAQNGAI